MTDYEKYLNPDLISEFPSKIFTVKMQPRGAGYLHTLTPEEREELRRAISRIEENIRLHELQALAQAMARDPQLVTDEELVEVYAEKEKLPEFSLKVLYSEIGRREVSRNHDAAPRPFMKCTPKMLDKILNK